MAEKNDGNGEKEEDASIVAPNTLAWAAHAYEKAEKLKKPVWRIVTHAGKGPEGCDSHPRSAPLAPAHRKSPPKDKEHIT